MKKLGLDRSLLKINEQLISKIKQQITLIEEQIEQIIQTDEALNQQVSLMRIIPAVGKVL